MSPKKGTPKYVLWCKRISIAKKGKPRLDLLGKPRSEKTKQKISATKKGKPRSEETKRKLSIAHSGKVLSAEHKQKLSIAGKGRIVSTETKQKMRGSNNPNWRGGISFLSYPIGWNTALRNAIRKRDNYTCALCEKPQGKRRHSVHHINYIKADLREENLITLCRSCHQKTSQERKYWKNLFVMVYVPDFPKIRRKDESSC